MRIHIIETVEDRAEGDCGGFPYNTELVNSNGCSVLFWTGDRSPNDDTTKADLEKALRVARGDRDIVRALACPGSPTGYWAHQDMPHRG